MTILEMKSQTSELRLKKKGFRKVYITISNFEMDFANIALVAFDAPYGG